MALPQRVQNELDAANQAELAYQQQRTEHAAQAVQDVTKLTAPEPESKPVSATPPVAVAPVQPAPPQEDFQHKYRVLQGMYEADVKEMKRELAALKAVKAEPPPPNPAVEKDIETFGADLIQMVQRYAEGQQAGTNARLDALEQQVMGVAQQTEATTESNFFKELESMVPDFRAINKDPKWLAWLGEDDPIYGVPRQAALDNAHAKRDVKRVAHVFNTFAALQPVVQADSSLTNQVVPSNAGNPPPPAAPAKQFISEKSILDFYKDVRNGMYVGQDEKRAQIEANIDTAVAEGRVR